MPATSSEGPYDIGDVVRVTATVTQGGNPVDPSTLVCNYKKPNGTLVTGNAVVRDGVGSDHFDISIDQSGVWWYRFVATGTGASSEESAFAVRTLETI